MGSNILREKQIPSSTKYFGIGFFDFGDLNWLQKVSQYDLDQIMEDIRKVHLDLDRAREIFSFWQRQTWKEERRPRNMPIEVFKDPLAFVKSAIDQGELLIDDIRRRRENADATVRQEYLDAYVTKLWSKWYLLNNDYQMSIAQINSRN